MSKPMKIVGIAVIVVALIAGVTGIAYATAGYEPKEPERGLYVDGQYVADPGVMLTVGDEEISFQDYYYYYSMNKSYMQMFYGEEFWKQDYDGAYALNLRKTTEQNIQDMYAWLEVAKEEGITLTDEEKQETLDTLAEQKKELGEDGFKENLESMFMTDEDMYVRITDMQKLSQKAQEEAETKADSELGDVTPDTEGLYTAKHILIGFDDEAEDPEEDETIALGIANDLYDQIKEAEEDDNADADTLFDELMTEYGEDPGVEENPDGYTFGEGEMVDEFFETTKSLKEGEVSEPVRTDYGYHIIKRLPLDKNYIEENKDSFRQEELDRLVEERIAGIKEKMPLGYGEYYNEVTPETMV